jgi:hypothetical protein
MNDPENKRRKLKSNRRKKKKVVKQSFPTLITSTYLETEQVTEERITLNVHHRLAKFQRCTGYRVMQVLHIYILILFAGSCYNQVLQALKVQVNHLVHLLVNTVNVLAQFVEQCNLSAS